MQLSRRAFLHSLSAVSLVGTASATQLYSSNRAFLFKLRQAGDHPGLPCGSVESYAIHPLSGDQELLSGQALSLSATMPRSLALAPDGSFLVVAAYGGGIYNVFPVSRSGKIGEVSQVFKELGCSIHPLHQTTSHPHSVVFHPSGKFLLATDLGADRITVFGVSNSRIAPAFRINTPPGSGPAKLQTDASGSRITVWHELKPLVARYKFDYRTGLLT